MSKIAEDTNSENKSCIILMDILHSIKHNDFDEVYKILATSFPNWREVEYFNGDESTAKDYLFKIVLK